MKLKSTALLLCIALAGTVTANDAVQSDSEKTCQQLSTEITELLEMRSAAQGGFLSKPYTRIAASATVVFEPAWFYLGYAAITHIRNATNESTWLARIKSLRTAAADKLCFVS